MDRDFFGSKREEGSEGDDGEKVEGEDGHGGPVEMVCRNSQGHKDQEDVDVGGVENGLDFAALER